MADELYIEMDAFSGLISTLDTAAEDMTSANDKLADTDGSDLGSTPLDKAAENFRDRWKYGIEKIADATGKMVDGLELTRDLYAEQERINAASHDAIANALPESSAPTAEPAPRATLDFG